MQNAFGKMMVTWIAVILSVAFPPLLVISVPLLIIQLVRFGRDAYLEERSLINTGKFWSTK
jgi:hypothetical protein